jgi:ubiquinone/menaquinone biosynthesis C-methylase UbiE
MPSGFQLARRQAEAYDRHTGVFMDGSAQLLAAGASIGPGDVVLDLACGTGLVAGHAAPLVSPGGRVVGADINPAMLAVARERNPDAVEWVEAPCDALPFDDATFTHVICQQGLQFFPDPIAALGEAHRVLRPGGVVIATVWATPGHNPYIEQQLARLAELDPSVVDSVRRATPPMADLFLSTTAEAAGFGAIGITMLEHEVDVPDLATWFLDQTGGTPWGPTIVALDDEGRTALTVEMTNRLSEYATPTGHRLPFTSYRLAATRPPHGRA